MNHVSLNKTKLLKAEVNGTAHGFSSMSERDTRHLVLKLKFAAKKAAIGIIKGRVQNKKLKWNTQQDDKNNIVINNALQRQGKTILLFPQ